MIGKNHEIKGQAISAFVTVKEGTKTSSELIDELIALELEFAKEVETMRVLLAELKK